MTRSNTQKAATALCAREQQPQLERGPTAQCDADVAVIRSHLKVALIDLNAAREKRRIGYAAHVPCSDMNLLEAHLTETSADVDALMQELISQRRDQSRPRS